MPMTSPLSLEITTCSTASATGGSASELPLRRIGEPVALDTPPSEVPDSDESNRAETDPAPPDHLTAPPDRPSEPDTLEDIFTCKQERTIGDSARKRKENVKITTTTQTYL
ncbi:hypothetical protein DEO72_LG1g2949 [Vigna unguiculata]|uniref:Uncharacterized protein n=1 Tax=Vigna unguiculata TaxID=3917 RepID=A0A4D6KRJ1_VIGUN|nr:hypothetical protein DEO72_LG1g2949 [Vigna unguiculata]